MPDPAQYARLLKILKREQEARGLSERAFCREAGIAEQAIKRLRAGHRLSVDVLAKLGAYLGDIDMLRAALTAGGEDDPPAPAPLALLKAAGHARSSGRIPRVGEVEAGAWRLMPQQPADGRITLDLPAPPLLPPIPRYAFNVRGTSMDKLYPDGSIVIAVAYADIGRLPSPGDRVICVRRDRTTENYEATLKEYDLGPDGQHILWPRSHDPAHQQPIILLHAPPLHSPADFAADHPDAEIILAGMVVQSLINEAARL